MKLAFDTFTLRLLRPSDAPSIARHANNRNVSKNLRDAFPFPYRLEDAVQFIEKFKVEQTRGLVLCIDIDGEAVGAIGVHPFDDVYRLSAELGYWLAEPFFGRGIMSQAVPAVCHQAFARDRDLVRLQANVFGWNPSSARVLEKAGFEREGVLRQSVIKDGVLADSWMYARLRS